MIYRLATPADIPALAQLRWDFRTERDNPDNRVCTQEEFLEAMRVFLVEAFESQRWVVWVAEENGIILSQVFLEKVRKVPRPSRLHVFYGYITNVYTRPDRRGQGIGAELMRLTVEWAHGNQVEMLILWPAQGRQDFYYRAGFSPEGDALSLNLKEPRPTG